ncbi:SpaA isopeptide-forming pilin-related protein [Collinsella aerofaciens]|uniref:Cna protein B-type domain protein n=1 Tax=Collinsella aerofaciens TaxID=74426 RepID=A0A5K1IZC2_9ACTN|nr:SpaA isopeptide-forming pilin-related protein [Collinsella aerofaciens]VWL94383.1 Cna protein B-type domain protein [Collinsella aerofaciens]
MSNAPTHSVHSAIATGPLLLLLFFLIGCLIPEAALAVDGSDALNFRTISDGCGPFGVGKYEAQDTSISYCMNQDCPGPSKPGGPWRTYDQGWTWLDDEFAAIVCHGYPSSTSFGGHNLSPDLARAATQIAVWMLNGTTHPDGTYSYTNSKGVVRSGRFYENAEAVAAARWLYESAKSGSIKAAPHRARRYHGPVSGEGRHQDMLYVLPAISVSFQKQSSQANITAGNDTYRLGSATFDIFESAGDARVGTIQTDENGRAQATLLPNTAYYLVETKAPAGYILRGDRIAFTTQNSGEHVTINEQPGTITLRIAKTDAATDGGAQVGASLAGAEFTCVSQSTPGWTRTLTTDENGRAILNDVPLGTFTIYESKAPEGYLISNDCWSYTVGAEQLGDTGIVELESRIPNIPIAFDLEISKFKDHGNNDESGLEQPAGGVVFEVVSNISQQVVGTLTTNVYGFASTKDQPEAWFGAGKRPAGAHGAIPYDRAGYTVREVAETVPEGFKQAGEWTIEANQISDGAELQYIVDNHALSTHLQIVKRDAQTGASVPLAGFTFQLLDSNHKPVSQTCWYPAHNVMNTFTTDATGTVTLPESLVPGTYYVRETSAKEPYLVGEEIEVNIPADINLTPVAIASYYDRAATGNIRIVKTNAVDGSSLAGAIFEIRASGDIVRPDGGIAAVGGETVATVTTDETGEARADNLPLGSGTARYEVVETQAPAGFLLDRTSHIVDLTYADQKTPVVEARLNVSDDYTKVDISKVDASGEQEVEGARLTLYGPDKTEIDSWTSSDKPHRVEHLAPGTYSLREMMSPRTYDLAEEITFEIKDTGEVQSVAMKDAPIEIKGQVDKRQELVQPIGKGLLANGDGKNRAATQTNTDGLFSYTIDARNDSATWVDEFTITDDLECAEDDTARFVSVETPVAIGDLNGLCNVWYRTSPAGTSDSGKEANATLDNGHRNPWLETEEVTKLLGDDVRLVDYDGWHLWKADIPTDKSVTLDTKEIDLTDDVVITGIRFEYGAVAADFTTRSEAGSWTRDDLKDEHDDLDDAKAALNSDARGAVVHMQATSSYTPQTALVNSARVDLCRNGGGDKLEAHDEDRVIQRCARPQNLPATGSVAVAACITALLTSGTAAIWFARLRSAIKKR